MFDPAAPFAVHERSQRNRRRRLRRDQTEPTISSPTRLLPPLTVPTVYEAGT